MKYISSSSCGHWEIKLTGLVVAELTTNSPSTVSIPQNQFIFTEENAPRQFTLDIDSGFSAETLNIEVANLDYALNFTNYWDLVFTPGKFLEYFGATELTIPLGAFPSMQWPVAQPTDKIGTITSISSSMSNLAFTSSSQSSSSSSSSISTSPGWLLTIGLLSMVTLVTFRIIKRKK